MFTRIVSSALAAAALATATPALANASGKDAGSRDRSRQCDCMAQMHQTTKHESATERSPASRPNTDKANQPTVEDDPFVRNQSWGG